MSISDDLKNWYSNHSYEQICQFYDQIKNIDEIQLSEWDFVYIMNSLYKNNRYADCLTLYKVCKKNFTECNLLNDKMAWCVYHIYLKDFNFSKGNHADFFLKVDYVLKNVNDGKYSAVHYIVKLTVKAIFNKQTITDDDYNRANKYLDCVNYNELSQEEVIFESAGKSYNLASDYEWWFVAKSKCLIKLKCYEECIKICNEALNNIKHFHTNNDSWLKYRKALCLLELKQFQESKKSAEDILHNSFRHWSIYNLLYEISVITNNVSDAMKYAGECSLADKSHMMRVNFYESYANFLNSQNMTKQAMLHLHLSTLIREENNWKSDKNNLLKIDEEILKLDKVETLKRLKPFWEKNRDMDKVFISGIVSRISLSENYGFVKSDKNDTQYYFKFRDLKCDSRRLSVGTKVRFVLEERVDKKRNILRTNAIELSLA